MPSSSRRRAWEPPIGGDDAAALVRRIRAGDASAETELVVRYRAGLTLLLRRYVKDAALAEDLCQDVFRIALRALRDGKLEHAAKLTAYLWGIARNLASSQRRHERRAQQAAASEALPDATPTADQVLLAAERARLVREAVNELSPRDRAVLTAFYLSDATKEAICRKLALTPAQFDLIKWRALKRLMAVLRMREGRDE